MAIQLEGSWSGIYGACYSDECEENWMSPHRNWEGLSTLELIKALHDIGDWLLLHKDCDIVVHYNQ